MTDADRPTLIARVNALIAVRDRLTTDLIRLGADPQWVARRAATDTWSPAVEHSWDPDAWPCAHTLSGLPCTNPERHKGGGLGCTHASSSGVHTKATEARDA